MKKVYKFIMLFSPIILLAGCWGQDEEVQSSELSRVETETHQTTTTASSSESQEEAPSSESSVTSESATSSTPVEGERYVTEFFPLVNNYEASFVGSGNEFAGMDRVYDYIDEDGYIQMRSDNSGTTVGAVYKVDETGVYKLFSSGEFYIRENYIPRVKDNQPIETLLKAPLDVGTNWEDETGSHEITGIDTEITTPYGKYEAIEVTETRKNYVTKDYFVYNLGLVKRISTYTDPNNRESYDITTELSSLETDGWEEEVNVYQLNDDATAISPESTTIPIETNDVMRYEFRDLMAGTEELEAILPEETEIQALYTRWHEDPSDRTLYVDFNENIEDLRGSTAVRLQYPAIFKTLGDYYYTNQVVPTVNGEPMTIDQVGTLEPGQAFPLEDFAMPAE